MPSAVLKVLFVLGATTAGITVSAGLAVIAVYAIFETGRDSWGAFGGFMLMWVLAGLAGGLTSLLASVHYVVQHSMRPWPISVWLGIVLGMLLGFIIRIPVADTGSVFGYFVSWLPGFALLLTATGFLGGAGGYLIGNLLGPRLQQTDVEK